MSWPRVRKVRLNEEERFHFAVADYLRYALPEEAWFTTIPTVGSSLIQGSKLKRKGYVAGTPDILIIYKMKAHWLELKAAKGTRSPQQIEVARLLAIAGSQVGLVKTLDQVEWCLSHWGIPAKGHIKAVFASPAVEAARRNPA